MARRAFYLTAAVATATLVSLLASVMVGPREVEAAFPGQNGRIVFAGDLDVFQRFEIYAVRPDGTDLQRLTNTGADEADPALSPDGSRVVFECARGGICAMNIEDREIARIGGGYSPTWSPDGTKIAYLSEGGLRVMDADGANVGTIADAASVGYQPVWSPDGAKIAFTDLREGAGQPFYDIYVVDADGTNRRALTDASTGRSHYAPTWSPDGTRIAYSIADGDSEAGIVDVADAENKSAIDLRSEGLLAWSPDGTRLARSDSGGISTLNTDGSGFSQIVDVGEYGGRYRWLDWQTLNNSSPTPPETTIISRPGITGPSATLDFVSSRPGSAFECSLDGSPYSSCDGPEEYPGLAEGEHTFRVRAKDDAGNTDRTPAERTWTVDATAPETTNESGPSGPTGSASASFAFSASEAGVTFECDLDGTGFVSPCSSPVGFTDLEEGAHTWQVRAVDAAGNTDPTPARRSWLVDTSKPSGTVLINGGAASTTKRLVYLRLDASDVGSGVALVRFRNAGSATWSAWQGYAGSKRWYLSPGAGTKTVYAQYRDRAGNVSGFASDRISYRR